MGHFSVVEREVKDQKGFFSIYFVVCFFPDFLILIGRIFHTDSIAWDCEHFYIPMSNCHSVEGNGGQEEDTLSELGYDSWTKDFGGLGLMDLGLRNRAVMNTWIWRYGNERDCLRRSVIAERNGNDLRRLCAFAFVSLKRKKLQPRFQAPRNIFTNSTWVKHVTCFQKSYCLWTFIAKQI